MGRISKQIGWSNEANLLYEILKEIQRLQQILSQMGITTTTTTTLTPTTTTTTTNVITTTTTTTT